ncbi:MAG: response regulator [Deltaproteobacteria bacterium]|nr:response regulator [Deltaproteobacteria bacterium]
MGTLPEGRQRVLVIDDFKAIRDIISKFFAHMGYSVVAADNGKEALGLFFDNPFSLVLTDLDMPEIDGLTLAFSIKQRYPHTPVVLITGSESEDIQKGLVDLIIPKPFKIKDLEQTAQRFLSKGKSVAAVASELSK